MPDRDERGNCLVLIVGLVALFMLLSFCAFGGESGSDCYHTPGAQPGSAQDQRDVGHCIEGR